MPRKGNTPKREVLPDPVYGSVVVAKLINSIMLDGKKGVAQTIVYDAFDTIKEKTGEDPLEVFEKAMNNLSKSDLREDRHSATDGSQDIQEQEAREKCPTDSQASSWTLPTTQDHP